MVVEEASIHNIMGGMESTGGVRLHNHKRKLKQRFDIIKKLGQGTYGKVQLGINKETGQEVAIKTIKKCKIETEADLVRIRREIQIMSSVQHPNIIHIYEVFENREKMVLVMEYAAGGELYDYLSQRKVLTEEEARRIFRQIVTAVFYCHKHNICHRDLKLENILLDQIGNAKIADFGLSNVFDGKRLLNTFCGSPLYASPEIVKGTPYHGPEVDCWSLGVLLYTLVYGAMPFDGSNFKRLVKQISSSDYFEPKVPSPASTLIKEMLTVCPGTRSDIQKICTHWWVNETYDKNCLLIAEELAAQTPVRLDLLLSLVPQSANADKLVVGEHQSDETNLPADTTSEVLMPTRSYSADNFMEFERSSSTGVMREITDVESSRQTNNGDAKRKLESTSSVDENMAALTKRKEILKTEKDNDNASSIKSQTPMDVDPTSEVLSPTVENTEKPLEINKLTPEIKSEGETISKVKPNKITVDLTGKHVMMDSITKDNNPEQEVPKQESPEKTVKKLRDKSHSLDSASISDVTKAVKTVERRRSKIFETAEKFNQMLSNVESEKPKKIFIPGVNVGGAKRAFERKASLNSGSVPISSKEKITPKLGKNLDKKSEKNTDEEKLTIDDDCKIEKDNSQEENTSNSSKSDPNSKRNLIIQLGPNDLRAATVTVSTPVDTKLSPELKQDFQPTLVSDVEPVKINSTPEKPKKSSKMEITLQSTAKGASPKTMKTEIMLGELKSPQSPTYKTEIEAKINSADPRKIQTQRSEVAFPIAAVSPQISASSSYDDKEKPTIAFRKERSVPIQMDLSYNPSEQKRAPLKYPSADYSESFERQSTIDSDTENTSKSVIGSEPIRKSPREYIIPIAVEGANYITPRADSVDIESKNSASSLSSLSRSRFGKSRRISSLLSDASEDDESPFLSLSRDSDDLFQRHMHRLRSSRPRRQPSDLADSLSSGEDDDDDGFELLTAENLFSTLLSRVRSLTQRLNVDDNKSSLFPNSRLLGRFDSNPSQSFWGTREPLSRRISESQFQRSSNCDMDRLSRKNSFGMMNPKYQDSQTSLGESSKESLSSSGRSNTLPRATVRVTLHRRGDGNSPYTNQVRCHTEST